MMTISIPDTLTIDNSEKYIVSIRLWPGGFSFSGYIPSEDDSFFYSEIELDRTVPYVSALKELFFSSDFLTWNYRRVRILYVTSQYTLVPKGVFQEEQKAGVLSFNFSAPETQCLTNALKEEEYEILFGLNEEVYEFCNRTLGNPDFLHHLSSSLLLWKRQSLASVPKLAYAVLYPNMLDLVCYDHGQLLFANSFVTDKAEDALYYILYVWQQQGLDPLKDQLYIAGDTSLCNNLLIVLQTYLRNIRQMPVPSEAYLIGMNVGKAPVDVISLLVCEL